MLGFTISVDTITGCAAPWRGEGRQEHAPPGTNGCVRSIGVVFFSWSSKLISLIMLLLRVTFLWYQKKKKTAAVRSTISSELISARCTCCCTNKRIMCCCTVRRLSMFIFLVLPAFSFLSLKVVFHSTPWQYCQTNIICPELPTGTPSAIIRGMRWAAAGGRQPASAKPPLC